MASSIHEDIMFNRAVAHKVKELEKQKFEQKVEREAQSRVPQTPRAPSSSFFVPFHLRNRPKPIPQTTSKKKGKKAQSRVTYTKPKSNFVYGGRRVESIALKARQRLIGFNRFF